MLSRIDRIRRAVSARPEPAGSERVERPAATNLPVPVEPVEPLRSFGRERRRAGAEFAAQLIGQDGQRRGLRAGPSMLDTAREAYNRIEWSGRYDRRARAGRLTREDV